MGGAGGEAGAERQEGRGEGCGPALPLSLVVAAPGARGQDPFLLGALRERKGQDYAQLSVIFWLEAASLLRPCVLQAAELPWALPAARSPSQQWAKGPGWGAASGPPGTVVKERGHQLCLMIRVIRLHLVKTQVLHLSHLPQGV